MLKQKNINTIVAKAANRLLRARPDFLIIGTQKAGTTSLFNYLATHPEISPAAKKEIHFFNIYQNRGFAWYLTHFPYRHKNGKRLCFEATPDYFHAPGAPELIRKKLGQPKLIVVLREPAARAYSAWKMWHTYSSKPTKQDHRSFTNAIRDELADPERAAREDHRYVEIGHYADHLARYQNEFDTHNMLVLDYDELTRSFEGFMNSICDFLDVERFEPEQFNQLGSKRYWTGSPMQQSHQDVETLELLQEYYKPHNQRLWELLGKCFKW